MERFAKVAKDLKHSLNTEEVEKIVGNVNKSYSNNLKLITAHNKEKLYDCINSNYVYDIFLVHYLTEIYKNLESGHWVCVAVDHFKKKIYFFDPYGTFVDDGLKCIPKNFRQYTGQDSRDIGKFMEYMNRNYGYTLYYSQHHYQKLKKGINTCGRWCGLFLRHIIHGGNEESFYNLVNELCKKYKFTDFDIFVTLITNNLIKK